MREQPTHRRILIEAQDLIQRHGFFGLSLQELANRISIRKPSLYAHYDSKESLGLAVLADYQKQFDTWAESIRGESIEKRLQSFFQNFENFLAEGKVCPNSSLGLEGPKLPTAIRSAYLSYLERQLSWIEELINERMNKTGDSTQRSAKFLAKLVLQQLMGAQLIARMTGDLNLFAETKLETTKLILEASLA